MAKVVVVGHRNPDTDAVVSAISFSYILRALGYDAEPRVVDEIQPETRVVLEKTRLDMPRVIDDVRVRVRDVMSSSVLYVYSGEPVKKAIDILVSRSIRSVPIVDRELRVVGILSVESFARRFLEELSSLRLTLSRVSIRSFVEISGSRVVVGSLDGYLSGRVYVAAMSLESVAARRKDLEGGILVVGDRLDVIDMVMDFGISAIVVTGGRDLPQHIVEKGRRLGISILISPHDTYTTLRLLDLSQPVEMFAEPAVTILESSTLSELRELMVRKGARSVVVVDELGRLRGIVTRSDLVKDCRKRVALVDHNEFSQSVPGIEEARIVAVVDHHRVSGDVETHSPILYRVEPVGSTNTIIWRMSRELNVEIPKNVAEAMLYAILSDTLLLRSSTTTDIDRSVANEIARYVGIDLSQAMEFMRIAMAANEPTNPRDIVVRDLKEYEFKGIRFGIAQVFTTNPGRYMAMVDRLSSTAKSIASEKGLEMLMLMVTDVVEGNSYVMAVGRTDIAEQALGIDLSKGFAELKGVTSRKSQVLPKILSFLEQQT